MTMTPWRPVPLALSFTADDLAETLDGGQAFRWKRIESETWRGVWSRHLAELRIGSGRLEGRALNEGSWLALPRYLGGETDWADLGNQLPWRSDPHLKACRDAFPGLRLLRQPFAEALLAFLCSATKQIPQIKVMCENLARELGEEIAPRIHALPTWSQVASASEVQLRSLGLGFRAKNIKRSADLIASQPGWLERVEALPYAEAKAALLELPGVGSKIADCALLFGARKFEAFPVDTWILQTLQRRYGLDGWPLAHLERFGRVHFGPLAGFAQQFLFSWERRFKAVAKTSHKRSSVPSRRA